MSVCTNPGPAAAAAALEVALTRDVKFTEVSNSAIKNAAVTDERCGQAETLINDCSRSPHYTIAGPGNTFLEKNVAKADWQGWSWAWSRQKDWQPSWWDQRWAARDL